MRRLLPLILALLLAAAACGGNDDTTAIATGDNEPTPTPASADADPDDDSDEEERGTTDPDRAQATPGPGSPGNGSPAATPAPVEPAPQGTVNRPRAGQYVYDLEGSRSDPTTVGQQPYGSDARAFADVEVNGSEYTTRMRSNQDPGSSTTRARWEQNRVLLLSQRIDNPVASFQCTFQPPVEILRIPLQAASWSASWSSDECSGDTEMRIVGQEQVTDATGQTWSTWKVENVTNYRFGTSVEGTLQGATWFSPDLGTAVKADQRNEGTFRSTGGSQPFSSHQITTLRRHP